MKSTRSFWITAALVFPAVLFAQAPAVITMDQEPHHHLSFKNDYVKVFRVEVAPGDSIRMHQHDHDTVAIAIGDQMVTVGFPDKPAVHQKNPDGQLRLQKTGYIHSTGVDPGTTYHTVAVELIPPQGNPRNLCAAVMAGEPLHCVDVPANVPPYQVQVPQFQSDQTLVELARVPAGQNITIGDVKDFELIVALDPGTLSPAGGKGKDQALAPGDFVWFVNGGPTREFTNKGDKAARIVKFQFAPIDPNGKRL
jgi:hypothetical protein